LARSRQLRYMSTSLMIFASKKCPQENTIESEAGIFHLIGTHKG
jgi:hypothetical protein